MRKEGREKLIILRRFKSNRKSITSLCWAAARYGTKIVVNIRFWPTKGLLFPFTNLKYTSEIIYKDLICIDWKKFTVSNSGHWFRKSKGWKLLKNWSMQILAGPFGIYGENGRQILHTAKLKPEKKSSNIWIILKA